MSQQTPLQEIQRQQAYLQAMGIQRWLPCQLLPNAPVSADWVADFVWPADKQEAVQDVSHVSTPTPAMSVSAEVPSAQVNRPASQRSREAALAQLSIEDTGSKPNSVPVDPVEETPDLQPVAMPERMRNPRFSLVFVKADDLLVVDSLPPHADTAINSAYLKLLNGLCRALNTQVRKESVHPFHWPPFAGTPLTPSGEEAQISVRRQLDVCLEGSTVTRILLLGEPAAQWLLQQDQTLESMRGLTFSLRSGVRTQVSYSISHMLKLPEFKADCWRDLQPLL